MNSVSKKEEMTPSALWLALTSMPRPHRDIPLPRKKEGTDEPVGFVRIWPLTQEEQMASNADADRFTKQLLKDPQKKEEANLGYDHTFTNEVAIQVLFRACRDVDDIKRSAFPSPQAMRATFTSDEVGVLFSHYCTVQAEVGPIRADLSKEEADALTIRIVEGGSAFPFDGLSWAQQRALVSTLVSQLYSFWMATCSAGSPPEVSSFVREHLQSGNASESSNDESADGPPMNDVTES